MKLNPVIDKLTEYRMSASTLDIKKQELIDLDKKVIDLSSETPSEETDHIIVNALKQSITNISYYPSERGSTDLVEAIIFWFNKRFGVVLSESEIVTTHGASEGIFHLPSLVINRNATKNVVIIPDIASSLYMAGAVLAGAKIHDVPCLEENNFLIDLDNIPITVLEKTVLFWLSSPHNPTGSYPNRAYFEKLIELANRYHFIIASDESYSETYLNASGRPDSILSFTKENVVCFNSLSKRSNMVGYRSGFMAGDRTIIEKYFDLRYFMGIGMPNFIQSAAVYAWREEGHVEKQRLICNHKRQLFIECFRKKQIHYYPNMATPYLWIVVPESHTSESFCDLLAESGILVTPGTFFGKGGKNYVRFSLTPTLLECKEAVKILDDIL